MHTTAETFYIPILQTLRNAGGKGKASEIIARTIQQFKFTDKELERTTKSGAQTIRNGIEWGRLHLVLAGYIKPPQKSGHGRWVLTPKGRNANLASLDRQGILHFAQKPGTRVRHCSRKRGQHNLGL
ncbi:MAG: winged helix-turn-helix domain-containing protein [Gammaproteobacteria bacterium]